MTTNVQQVLTAFDALSLPEKREAIAELLRRLAGDTPEELSDDALTAVADGLFAAIDADEASDARS